MFFAGLVPRVCRRVAAQGLHSLPLGQQGTALAPPPASLPEPKMSIPGWKNFSFFDKEGPIPEGSHEVPEGTTCCASGDGDLVFGCLDGTASVLGRDLRCSLRWPAHTGRVCAVRAVVGRKLLVTAGEEEIGAGAATMKLWDLGRRTGTKGIPELIRGVKLFHRATEASEVTCVAAAWGGGRGEGASSAAVTVAVGLADGTALLIRGDMGRERLQRARVSLAPPGTSPGACAGLELANPPSEPLNAPLHPSSASTLPSPSLTSLPTLHSLLLPPLSLPPFLFLSPFRSPLSLPPLPCLLPPLSLLSSCPPSTLPSSSLSPVSPFPSLPLAFLPSPPLQHQYHLALNFSLCLPLPEPLHAIQAWTT